MVICCVGAWTGTSLLSATPGLYIAMPVRLPKNKAIDIPIVATLTRNRATLLARLGRRLVVFEPVDESTFVLVLFVFTGEPPLCLKSCDLVIRCLQLSIGLLQCRLVVV
jgi:hypothetical protein